MNKILIIIKKELLEKIESKSFWSMAIIGPLLVLLITYLLFNFGNQEKAVYKALIMDENAVFDNKFDAHNDPKFKFDFIGTFIDYPDFANDEKFEKYDLAIWINEKVVTNKKIIVSYKEEPSEATKRRLIYHLEKRMDEIMISQFTDLSISAYRKVKQPLSISFLNTYDPKNLNSKNASFVGFSFGVIITAFILFFGMSILRNIANEKSNRVVELLVSIVKPSQFLSGKIIGIGITALIQFSIWIIFIALGLYIFRQTMFPDLFDPAIIAEQLSNNTSIDAFDSFESQYNNYVDLVYNQIHFFNLLIFFILFFVGGFLFYGAIFAAIGASVGSSSDGQQFIIPLNLLILGSIISGLFKIYSPSNNISTLFDFLPFTSPMNMMIRLANGFEPGNIWQLYTALFILYLFAFALLKVAANIYKNGILNLGHRLKIRHLIRWVKN